jgi:hypothetical protein
VLLPIRRAPTEADARLIFSPYRLWAVPNRTDGDAAERLPAIGAIIVAMAPIPIPIVVSIVVMFIVVMVVVLAVIPVAVLMIVILAVVPVSFIPNFNKIC